MKNGIAFVTCLIGLWFGLNAQGAVIFTNLFSFSGTNGIEPEGQLLQTPNGILYGTARDTSSQVRGNANFGHNGYNGTVFKVTTNGEFSILAFFTNRTSHGGYPRAGLTWGNDWSLYGTTVDGGPNGEGTVYRITTNGTLTVLASFSGTNGSHPITSLLKIGSNTFVGTTIEGGLTNGMGQTLGTVFSVTSEGVLRTLAFFNTTNGSHPQGRLIQGKDGALYGTTLDGGLGWLQQNGLTNEFSYDGFGTVFKMTQEGRVTTLAAFNGYNGMGPKAIAQSPNGDLYGITTRGGATNMADRYTAYEWSPFRGEGTIFKIEPNGKLTTLVLFDGSNGKFPCDLTLGKDGDFYGTTMGGGAHNFGIIFKLTPAGKFKVLYSFTEDNGNWRSSFSSVLQGIDGSLYGTSSRHGVNRCGSIFRLSQIN